jgi:pimeloyl-ACP methyl ester carboxylesterase
MRDWAFQIPALAAERTVIAVDSRGHGRSTGADHPITYGSMTSDVVRVMDALATDTASIIGWSDGAIIGLLMAIHYPNRVGKLFAFGANYNTDGLKPSLAEDPTLIEATEIQRQFYEQVSPLPDGFDTLMQRVHAMWATEPDIEADALQSIRTPTVIADGDCNEAIRPEHTKELARLIPGARHLVFRDAGDLAPWEDPAAFNRAIADFLRM